MKSSVLLLYRTMKLKGHRRTNRCRLLLQNKGAEDVPCPVPPRLQPSVLSLLMAPSSRLPSTSQTQSLPQHINLLFPENPKGNFLTSGALFRLFFCPINQLVNLLLYNVVADVNFQHVFFFVSVDFASLSAKGEARNKVEDQLATGVIMSHVLMVFCTR